MDWFDEKVFEPENRKIIAAFAEKAPAFRHGE